MSVSHLTKCSFSVSFSQDQCKITNPSGSLTVKGEKHDSLFILCASSHAAECSYLVHAMEEPDNNPTGLWALVSWVKTLKGDLGLWHNRFGHTSEEAILKLERKGMVIGMEIIGLRTPCTKVPDHVKCIPCLEGKQTRASILVESNVHNAMVLFYIYSDVCGSISLQTREEYSY